MIQEYEDKFALKVTVLGRSLNESWVPYSENEYEHILLYTKGEDVLGFVQYMKLYETVEILYIVVDEQYRRLGIGSEFIEHLSRDLDVSKMILEVRASNEGAISFYERNGFRKVRPIKNYYKDGEDAISMEKVIS